MVVMDVVVFMLEMVVMFLGVSCFVVFHVQKFDFERKDMLIEFRSQHTRRNCWLWCTPRKSATGLRCWP